jgi:hypothetical protein
MLVTAEQYWESGERMGQDIWQKTCPSTKHHTGVDLCVLPHVVPF